MPFVSEYMSRDVTTIESTASVRQAARLMAEKDIGFLPVLHESVAAGIVTDRDIVVRAVAGNLDLDQTCVAAILSTDSQPRHQGADEITSGVGTLLEDTPVESALQFMDERGIRRATVHDREFRLVGVISRADLPATANARA
jgi:CBS domain-containing protein